MFQKYISDETMITSGHYWVEIYSQLWLWLKNSTKHNSVKFSMYSYHGTEASQNHSPLMNHNYFGQTDLGNKGNKDSTMINSKIWLTIHYIENVKRGKRGCLPVVYKGFKN